jgi:hypothetical protein
LRAPFLIRMKRRMISSCLGRWMESMPLDSDQRIMPSPLALTSFTTLTTPNSLELIVPHMGMLGGDPLDILRTFKDRENVYFDTVLQHRDTSAQLVRQRGRERILFGSDMPFGSMGDELNKVPSLRLGDDDKGLILSRESKEVNRIK